MSGKRSKAIRVVTDGDMLNAVLAGMIAKEGGVRDSEYPAMIASLKAEIRARIIKDRKRG